MKKYIAFLLDFSRLALCCLLGQNICKVFVYRDLFFEITRNDIQNRRKRIPKQEWTEKYEAIKENLICKMDLDAYFTKNQIGNKKVDTEKIDMVHFLTGTIFASGWGDGVYPCYFGYDADGKIGLYSFYRY